MFSFQNIQVTFTDFDLESGKDCDYDSVTIFDGPDVTHPQLTSQSLCGDSLPVVPVSSGNQLYVVFATDSSQQANGFKLTWAETGWDLKAVLIDLFIIKLWLV